jgi:ParB-like chromosome segregation protein Spo0J
MKKQEQIVQNIVILPELQSLIPPLLEEEYLLLESSILAEGCRERIILWKQDETSYVLIDGHNRYSICQKHNKPFEVKVHDALTDLDAVKDWMIDNQLGKRNVTEETKSYLRGLQYNREKLKMGGDRKSGGQFDHLNGLKTHERLGEQHKVSAKTIQRDEVFALALDALVGEDKELKWKILNRHIQVPKSAVEKIAKKFPDNLETLGKQIASLGDFGQAMQAVFPKEKQELFVNTDDKEIVSQLKKAVQARNKETLEALIQSLQSMMKEW